MKKITEILIASGNQGKVKEIAELLKEVGIKAISAAEFNLEEPEENGISFEENSQIKAKYYGEKTGMVALADDSGLCIDALGGDPGIYSARWALNEKAEKDFALAFERIKQQLIAKNIDIEKDKISAHFICNLSLFNPESEEMISFEGRVDGVINLPAKGDNGFGYDPIFIADGMNQTFGEILPEQKDLISHRTRAFEKLKEFFNN